ncbi:surface lipoprotein assembly modifier [Marinobacter sp.]|uniref:surface lipoprotein assembly modifier n=1 Tax=Marinobacter sp. TaxID=50741 RepID=UPI003A8F36E4
MYFTRSLPHVVTVLSLTVPIVSAQAAEESAFNGHLSTGVEHDNNVSVDDLNASSDRSDQAWVFDAGLEGVLKPAERLNLTLGYSLSASRYQELDQFNQDIHLLSADLSYDFHSVTIGTSYHYSHSILGSEPFLDFHRASAYLGSLLGDDVYLSASLQDKRKDYDESNTRDSDIRGASLDSFFFFNQVRSHFKVGVDYEKEDARADFFDNDLWRIRATLLNHFTLGGEDNRFRLGWRFETREYDQPEVSPSNSFLDNPFTGNLIDASTSRRADQAHVLEASWRIGLNKTFSLEPSVSHGIYRGDGNTADYTRTIAGISLRAGF